MVKRIVVHVLRDGQPVTEQTLQSGKALHRIGTSPTVDVLIADAAAAPTHAAIEVSATGVSVVDMGAAQGTTLNGKAIDRAPLSHGDSIGIGRLELVVAFDGAPLPTAAPEHVPPSAASTAASEELPKNLRPLGKAVTTTLLPGQDPEVDPDDTLEDDDPMLARIRQRRQKQRVQAVVAVMVAVVAVVAFVGLASQQEPPVLNTAYATATGDDALDPEREAALARFDTEEPRDSDKYLYYRLSYRQSLWDIANKYYPEPDMASYLLLVNPKVSTTTEKLNVDEEVRILRNLEYVAQNGDTLESIAQAKLASVERVEWIKEANPQLEKVPLVPGLTIKVPLIKP